MVKLNGSSIRSLKDRKKEMAAKLDEDTELLSVLKTVPSPLVPECSH